MFTVYSKHATATLIDYALSTQFNFKIAEPLYSFNYIHAIL